MYVECTSELSSANYIYTKCKCVYSICTREFWCFVATLLMHVCYAVCGSVRLFPLLLLDFVRRIVHLYDQLNGISNRICGTQTCVSVCRVWIYKLSYNISHYMHHVYKLSRFTIWKIFVHTRPASHTHRFWIWNQSKRTSNIIKIFFFWNEQ